MRTPGSPGRQPHWRSPEVCPGAGVREQQVEAAELLARISDPGLQRVAIGDIDRGASCAHAAIPQGSDSVFDLIGAARADRDVRAFAGKRVSDRASDAARAT